MGYCDTQLWHRVASFPLDAADSELPMSQRLARENGWNLDFTRRVLTEYRRFLFLAATSGQTVSPSDSVDQAWHLHLLYTRSYWDELCGQTLGMPIHHGPTRGGRAEAEKHRDLYAQTLTLYREVFGEEPPHDIWPTKTVATFRRINVSENWVVPKPTKRTRRAVAQLSALVAGGATMGASGAPELLIGLILVGFPVAIIVLALRSASRQARGRTNCKSDSDSSGCGAMTFFAGCGSDSSGGDSGGGDSGSSCSSGCSSGCGGGGCGS